jgi:hypothetical protein
MTLLRLREANGDSVIVARKGLGAFGHLLFGVEFAPDQERQRDRSEQYPQHVRSMPGRRAETRVNFSSFKET